MKVKATKSNQTLEIDVTQGVSHVIEHDDKCVAIFGDFKTAEQNAKHFEKCVNCHDEMLQALIHARDFIIRCDDWKGPDPQIDLIDNAIKKATI